MEVKGGGEKWRWRRRGCTCGLGPGGWWPLGWLAMEFGLLGVEVAGCCLLPRSSVQEEDLGIEAAEREGDLARPVAWPPCWSGPG